MPVTALANHCRLPLVIGLAEQINNQRAVDQWGITGQHQHPGMACHCKPRQHAGQRPGEVGLGVTDQLIGKRPVLVLVAVAGNDQVIGQGPHDRLDMGNQWLALPGQQALVLAAHALAATAGQQKNGAGWSGGGHG
ncbi:hypothetical protein D3C79_860650 [compost metagenome]